MSDAPNAADRLQLRIGQLRRVAHADHQRARGPAVLQRGVAGDVVAVAVRAEDGSRREPVLFEIFEDRVRLETRVEHDAVIAISQVGDVGVLVEGQRNHLAQQHFGG